MLSIAGLEQELNDTKTKLQTASDKKQSLKARLDAASKEQEKLLQALDNSQQVVLKISNDFSELNKKVNSIQLMYSLHT